MTSSFYRGEEMKLCQMYFQSEVVYSSVSQLGEMGVIQFKDLNPDVNAFQRKFVNEVRRCEEIERKIRYIEKEISKEKDIEVQETDETCEAPKPKDMIPLEVKTTLNKKTNIFTKIDQIEHDLLEVNSNKDALRKNYLELIELRSILSKAAQFFEEHEKTEIEENVGRVSIEGIGSESNSQALRLGFITGIMKREKVPSFELMLWRFCRGNVYHKTADLNELIEDPQTGALEAKTVFIIFFQGEQLKIKCKKICDGFGAKVYPCPETQRERRDMSNGVNQRLDELKTVLDQSLSLRKSLLANAAQNVKTWLAQAKKMKAIYHTMNMFRYDQKSAIAECWAPVSELPRIRDLLDKESKKSDSNTQIILNIKPTTENPPTFNRTNNFTSGFQNIVNAYGVPNYREINPAPFYTVTFPFLFGVMFGDAGHGLIIVLVALLLVKKEAYIKKAFKGNEIIELFLGGRYIMLLMGIFSIYAGLIYNDFFAKSANIFGSEWRVNVGYDFPWDQTQGLDLNPSPYLNDSVKMYSGHPYLFGFDPIWALANNKITFTNTLKMKFSVVIGIMQMIFGLILGLKNHLYFRRKISIYFEFIPQIIFITLIFAYLCLMIFIKWLKYAGTDDPKYGACAPNLLIELINMFFLKDSSIDEKTGKVNECIILYPGQHYVQNAFVIISMFCIPVMLFTKPFLLWRKNQTRSKYGHRMNDVGHQNPVYANRNGSSSDFATSSTSIQIETQVSETNPILPSEEEEEHDGEFDLAEVFVEQTIHTIEYFLGCVSHTASYLRLWALSLAHAQLSEVLWKMLFTMGLKAGGGAGPFMMYFIFQFWAGITIGIMCVMEGLSAFLHALRLHWVEFQSKFYKGEGYEFIPFSFERILRETDA